MQPNSTCNRSSRGLTLLETLITLALLSVIFGMGANLLQGAYRAVRAVTQRGQVNEALQTATTRMFCEARECQNITAADGTHLVMEIVNPAYPSGAYKDDPYDAHNLLVVTYETDGKGKLLRTVAPKLGTTPATTTEVVADGIQGLNATWTPSALPGTLSISVSVNDDNAGVRTLSGDIYPMAAR